VIWAQPWRRRGGPWSWIASSCLPTPSWADYKETFAEAKRRNWHLHLYVESKRLPEILPVFLDTGAAVVVPHMGMFEAKLGPQGDPGFKVLVEAAKSGHAYVMLSAPYRTSFEGARVAAPILLEAYGPDRLLWGSDWPHTNTQLDRTTTYPKMLQSLAEWVPYAATRRTILQDTPTRLFRFA